MKKMVEVEQKFCDVCGKSSFYSCDKCGKDLCYDCVKTEAVEYKHAVSFSGSGDGLYCNSCDAELLKSNDKLHAAFRKIKALRNEAEGWNVDFRERAKAAEENLKSLQSK